MNAANTRDPYHVRVERDAAEKLWTSLNLPLPENRSALGSEGYFNPWDMFPVYGSFSSEFDGCALDVLIELSRDTKSRGDLGAEMFREMLCTMHLCNFGSSPRECFPTTVFRELLPALISKWRAYYWVQWGGEYVAQASLKASESDALRLLPRH